MIPWPTTIARSIKRSARSWRLTAQTQDAVNSFRERFGDNRLAPRRLATLVSSALFKRQAERIGMGNQRMFTDEAEALAWLLSDTGD